jgi:hypothetical protein
MPLRGRAVVDPFNAHEVLVLRYSFHQSAFSRLGMRGIEEDRRVIGKISIQAVRRVSRGQNGRDPAF